MTSILRVKDRVYADNSISSNTIRNYVPYANTSFGKSDEIRIPIHNQNSYTLPSKSTLLISGKLINKANLTGSKPDGLKFISNGVLFLFDEIRYELSGHTIDKVRNPGVTTNMKNLISVTESDLVLCDNAGWNSSNDPNFMDDKGNFNLSIPLSMLLGFCEDYKKIIINTRQELVLLRSSTDLNCIVTSVSTEIPSIEIEKITWRMPHIQVSDMEKIRLMEIIDSGMNLELAFRGWDYHEWPLVNETTTNVWNIKTSNQQEKPRYVIFGLQTAKKGINTRNMSTFSHCNLRNIKLYLNSDMYPYENINLNIDSNQVAILYDMYTAFQASYYGRYKVEPCLSRAQFIKNYPIVVIDCSQQNESLKGGIVDIRVEFETEKNIPDKTTASCLIIHDRLLAYNPLTGIVAER